MLKKILLGSLAITVCLSLLISFTSCTATSQSPVPPAQTTTTSQLATTTTVIASTSPAQTNPVPLTTSSITVPTNVSNGPNIVNLPSFAALLSIAKLAVVEINTSGTVTAGRRTVLEQGAGSGWIMDANGTIVTNDHVIAGASTITVTTSDGTTYPAQVINGDPVNDLALLKINAPQLTSINIGDASKLQTGDWVLAIGNPLGQGIIATQGIVSRLGVSVAISSTQTYNDLIETTAAINPGNSGGPLINLAGEVVGITSLNVSASGVQGMGYAISMVDALPVIQKLAAP